MNNFSLVSLDIQPIHLVGFAFVVIVFLALIALGNMSSAQRSKILFKVLSRVALSIGAFLVGALILTTTTGGAVSMPFQSTLSSVLGEPAMKASPLGGATGSISSSLPAGATSNPTVASVVADPYAMLIDASNKISAVLGSK